MPIADALWQVSGDVLAATFFLPSPETWLEWRVGPDRLGYLLRASTEAEVEIYVLATDGVEHVMTMPRRKLGWYNVAPEYENQAAGIWNAVAVFLAIINTPRLVGRRYHNPHRGLEREIRRAGNSTLQLRPWSEIRLEITPKAATGEGPERLCGRKCLHFCRSHIRVQNGRLVVVRSHWRGDAALGVVQATYRVVA